MTAPASTARPVRAARRAGMALATSLLALGLLLAACGSTPVQTSPAQIEAAVGHAYATLFDFADHDIAVKTAVIENGSTLRGALTQALSSSLAKRATGAKVSKVQLLSASACRQAAMTSPCARVTYNLLSTAHTPLFATPSIGYAVSVGGHWLVAKSTICGLLSLFYSTSGRSGSPPGC